MLRGAGDEAFISTLTPFETVTKKEWKLTLDIGKREALWSEWKFSRQNIGGPFQFTSDGSMTFHLPGNPLIGYRFHPMSDATNYGKNHGVSLHRLELSYSFE